MAEEMSVMMAAFDDRQLVENQWGTLQRMIRNGELDLDDAAVIANVDGKVGVMHNLHHPVRKGLLVGAVLAVAAPIGLAAGLLAGGLGGKFEELLRRGLPKSSMEAIGEHIGAHPYMVIVAGRTDVVKAVAGTMVESPSVLVDTIALDGSDLREAAEDSGGGPDQG